MNEEYEGWTWLTNSRKWHYFKNDRQSLCGKFLYMGAIGPLTFEQDNDDSPDNCAACRRKLKKIREGRK